MNVLVVAPHPDDEAIGCGGALCLHAARGDQVSVVFLTSGELGLKHLPREKAWAVREAEAEAAADVLGVSAVKFLRCPDWSIADHVDVTASGLRSILDREEVQLVYVPHSLDGHPDHRAALPVLRAALQSSRQPAPSIRTFEVWTPLMDYDHVEDISLVMRQKLSAVRCYRSQLGYFRYDRAVRGLNQYRGALAARCRFAEVFRHVDVSESGPDRPPEGL